MHAYVRIMPGSGADLSRFRRLIWDVDGFGRQEIDGWDWKESLPAVSIRVLRYLLCTALPIAPAAGWLPSMAHNIQK